MLPEVMFAYGEEGFRIDLGNPSRVYSTLIDRSGKRSLSVSGGLTVTVEKPTPVAPLPSGTNQPTTTTSHQAAGTTRGRR